MKGFTFDLQRFADVCSLNGTNYSSLAAAYAAAQNGDTITLLQDASGNGFEIAKNITFDLGGYTYTLNYSADYTSTKAFTSSTGANYTFKNGTLNSRGSAGCINNSGTLTLEDINIASTTRAYVSTTGTAATNSIKGASSVIVRTGKDASDNNISSKYALDNGLVIATATNSTSASTAPTITTQSDKSAVVTFPNANTNSRYYFTVSEPGSKEVTYSPNVKVTGSSSSTPALYVAYDSSGNPSIQNLGSGLVFTVATNDSSGSSSVQYTVTVGGLYATSNGITKVLQGVSVNPDTPIEMTYLDFADTNSYMVPAIFASSGVLTVSSTTDSSGTPPFDWSSLDAGDELLIVDDSDYTKSYGTLTKVDDNTFALTKTGGNTSTLSRIVINDALTARISADFRNIPITAYVSNRIATSLTSSSSNPFTLSSDTGAVVSLQGDVNVSLIGGSINASSSQTTIRAGGNTIQYTGGVDGVNVIASSGNVTINDIDESESFNVGSNSYWREDAGLRTGSAGVFTSDVATIYSTAAKSNLVAVDLASLRSSVASFAQPENGVLEIGKNNIGNLVIVNDKSDPTIKYAELKSSVAGNYNLTLTADSNAESFRNAVDTISLAGGTAATINKNFVYGSSKTVTLAAGAGSTPDATFKVTEVSGDTFVVTLKTSSAETIITGATGITLLSGTINAKRGQTITLGDGGRAFYVSRSSAGMNVTFDNGTATITAAAGDTFTIDGQSFTVDSNSDGMTFTVTADNIIANDLGTADGDAFTYGGATYSVRGAGFIRTVGENQSIWSDIDSGDYTGNHSLTSGTVTIESLPANDDHVWDAVATVRASDNSATLPPSDTSTKVTLIGNDLKQTYGIFTKSGAACTLTTGSGNNEAKLSKISVGSGVDNFSLGAGLDSITINSAVASLMVTEDDDDGYSVTLIGSTTDNKTPAILDGISRVSLISGSLRSDSAFTTNVLDKGIVAIDQSVTLVSDTSDASINGLEVGHRFSVEGGDDFNMSEVGLVNKEGRYLLGTRAGNPIIFSELDSDTPWGGLIAAENLTITSSTTTALVVDNTVSPSALYADYININGSQSLRAANSADAWPDVTIYISDTTVTLTSYFEDKKIQGVSSKAAFTVEDGVNFSVQDLRTGAVIGSATNISQTAGIISLTSGQAIHSGAGSIKAATGNLTFTVNDTAGTIGALDTTDVFSLSAGSSGNIEYTRNNVGIVTDDNRILTGLAVRESVTVAQLLGENWTNTVQINSAGVLALPPTVSSDLASPWIILSNDKDSAYGTLEQTDSGYSIHRSNNAIASLESDWASSNTISLLSAQPVTLTKDYSGAWISGLRSGASVSTSDATDDFTVTDGSSGATVSGSGAVKVNQKAGVVVPWVGQTVTAADNYAIAVTSNDGDIKISVSGSDAIVTNLSEGDTFTINDRSFEVLTGGVIRRDGSELRQGSTSESAADLIDNWLGKLEIEATQAWVMDGDYLRNNMTADKCYIVDKDNNNNVYGTIERATSGTVTTYTVSVDGANVTPFSSVTINTNIERVTFAKEHYITNAIPITAGNATFTVTDLNVDSFTVTYDGTAGVETATTLTLSSGTLKLTDTAQVVTMGSTTAAVNDGTITVNYDGTTVTVGSMHTAGDSVKINGTYDYTYNSGNGMTIEVAGGVTTFKNLDDDSFTTPDGVTYSINANGFVKNDGGTNYMWTSSTDVSSNGVTLSELGNSSNWTQIAVVSDGDLTVDSTSTATVVLVGNTDNPAATIYGTLNVSGSERTLTADGGKNAELNSITINGVTVTVASDFSKVPIIPKGSNPTINTTAAMTFRPEDDGQVFKVVLNGEETEYTYSVDDSNYRLSRGSEGNILTLTQNNNTYTLPGGRWVTSGGTFTIPNGESVILEYGTTTTTVSCHGGDYITARGAQGQWQEFGGLTAGDEFSITTSSTTTSYKVLNDGKTLGKYDATDGTINTVLSEAISDTATLTYDAIANGTYNAVMTLTEDGVLNLTAQPSATYSAVKAYVMDSDGDPDPTKPVANVSYDGTKYVLNTPGSDIDELQSVSLGAVTELSTAIDTVVTTPTTGTFTVNDNPFTARSSALQIQSGTSSGDATLIGGAVTVAQGSSVTTLNNNITNTIAATSGAVTVTVGDNVTIGSLTAGKVFSVDGTAYTVTSIGLTNADVTRLLDISSNAVTTAAIGGSDWQTVYEAPSGALTINSDTPTGVTVVNISNPSSAVKYGTLARSGSAYAFTSSGSDKLSSITVDGVEAVFDSSNAGVTINAGDATFSVSASGNFTVDATSTPELSNVESVTLTSGTIQAPTDVTVTVGTRRITATEGTMNVGLESNKVVVSALNTGDKFNVGNVSYEMMSTGLYNSTSGQIVTSGVSDDKTRFIVDDAAYGNIITLDSDNNLDLTGQPSTTSYTALVVGRDSDGNVDLSKTIATVEYDGTGFTLTAGGNVSDMASVSLDAVKTLTTAIETAVKATSTGTYSINSATFAARDALELETTSSGAILTSGTVTLAQGNSVITPTNTVTANTGTVFANVSGSTITVSNLAAGRVFSVDDTSYTMTAIGLSDGTRLLERVKSTNTVTSTDLSGSDWQTILQATGGALSITTGTTSAIVADMTSATSAVKYGTLTRSGSAYTYARNDSNTLTSITLSGVAVTFDRSNAGVSIDTGSATFSVSASARNFTVDATSTPSFTNVTAITLTSGTIQAPSSIPVTVGSRRITATNGAMNIGLNSSGQTVISELNTGDTFTIGNASYEMMSTGLYNSTSGQLVTAGVSDDMTQFIVDDAAFGNVIALDEDGTLDLSSALATTSYTAFAVGRDSDGNVDVSKAVATVEYDGTGYTLTADANVSEMTSVTLNSVKTLTTAIETNVNATTTGTYTINGTTFVAREPLTIETTPDSAILIDGTVGLAQGNSVTTPSNTIDATTGTVTVEVDGSTVNIGSLAAGKVFEVDDTPYTMTMIGLTNEDRNRLLEIGTSTTVAALGGSAWQNILQATGGALSIDSSIVAAIVADLTSATSAVKYGTLTKSGSAYTYTKDGSTLSSITLGGVAVTFDRSNAGVSIDTGNATFSVSASSDFTVDATSTPELSNVTAVTLTSGTIQAPSSVPITVGSRRITATNGAMTVGLESNKVVVGELNTGDTFTVGNTSYEMTAAGLYDAANGQIVTSGVSDDMTTFIVDDAAYGNVVSLDEDGNLDLRTAPASATYTALVVGRDSDGNVDVTKPVATLSYDGTGYTLTAGANASEMTSVSLSAVSTLTTAIETTVVTPSSGTYTVNDKSFTARAALEIETSSGDATLASGTVSLTAGSSVDTPSNTVTATTGTITVAVSGSRVTISNLSAGKVFSVDDTSYTMTAIGLSDGSRLLDVNTAVTIAALGGTNWQNILQATDGALSIDSDTTSAAVVADLTSATSAVKYGNLTKSGSAFSYAKDGSTLSSITLGGVEATFDSSNAGVPIDTGSATFTVSASSDFTVDATSTPELSNVTAVTLTSGTIQAPQDVTITVGSRRITATNGTMNVGLNSSGQTVISELNTGDTFNVGNTSYEMTAAGLYDAANGQIVTSGVSDDMTTFIVDDAAFGNVITLDTDGNLDLTAAHVAGYTALVVGRDSSGNIDLTKRVANVTCDGTSYTLTAGANVSEMTSVSLSAVSTLDTTIETTVTTPASGTYTINGDSFAARSALTIETESGGATLIGGTVALTAGNSVDTPNNTIASTAGTITVNVDGSRVTIGNLTAGKVFSVDENAYTMTQIGLSNDNRLLSVSDSVTLDELGGSDWQHILQATGGALSIDGDTTAGAVVDISSATNAVKYGDLTKSGSAFSYTRDGNNTLGSIALSGVAVTFDSSNAGVPIDTGDATFTVSASGDFTVDATSTPELSNVTAISLTGGTIKAPNDITVSVGTRRITATGGDMTVGLVDNKVVISELNTGDTFNVGNISYEMTNAGLYDAVNGQIVTEGVSEDRTTFVVDDAAFGNVITLDSDGCLDLTATPVAGYAALVVGLDDDGNIDIAKAIATVEYDGTGYTLTQAGSYITELNGVLLSTVKTLDTSVATTVLTNAISSYTVNDKTFDATTPLEITTTATSASLSDGTVNVAAGYDLNTPNNTIASTAGTITVEVDDSTVTIGNLAAGRAFSVDDTDYSMTSIGLSDGNRILQIDSDVTLDELNGSDWLAILNAPSGALSVTADTASSIVVDISNPSSAVNYGILAKEGTNYTYVQSGSNVLQSVTLDGVSATFPQTCAAATFTAGDSTFSISASGDFTVNDTGSVPAIGGATAVTLTAGTIQPELDIPVTVGSRKITATGGSVTVGLVDGKTQIGALNAGDAFTVGNTAYFVTTAGELFDETDSMIVTSGFSGDTFTLDDATLTRIITADGTNLDLTDQTQSALVYDSDTNPTALLATLGVTGSSYTLSSADNNIIRTVDIKAGSELNIDFDATISGSGSVEVNDVTYNGTGDLIIYADDTASQLYSGTITLTPAVTAPEAANDSATLAVENGSITATAVNGYYTTLGSLDSGDSFTYNGNTYTQSKFGLLNDGNICENLAGSTLTLSALDSASWSEFLAPVANVLDLTSASVNAAVYDDYTAPTRKLAELSIVNGRKILKGASGAARAIQTVVLNDGDTLTVDFSTQVSAGSATVNGTTYIGTSDLIIDAKANGSSLYSGSVTVDAGRSLKATNDSAALAVTSGSVVAAASQGNFISLNDVDAGDAFTFNGNTYTMTALGLLSGNTIAQELNDSFIDLTTLGDAQWLTFIAPKGGTLDISNVTSNKIVFNSTSNPVNKLADLIVDGSDYTLIGTQYASAVDTVHIAKDSSLAIDFAAQVTAPIGTATVNGKSFNATTAVTLDATADNATLARGTVALDNADSVTTSSGYTVTANAGNGIQVVSAQGSAVTVAGLNAGDDFSVDGRDYSLRDVGLLRDDLIYQNSAGVLSSGSVSVDALLSDHWRQAIFIDGSLNLPIDFNSAFLLDEDLTRLFGYLTRNGRAYSLTAPSNVNAKLSDISLDAVSLVADSAFATVPLSANDSQFADVLLSSGAFSFTLDATDTPTFTGVASFTLVAGSVAAMGGQNVTAGSHVISGDLTVSLQGGVIVSGFGDDFTLDGDTYHVAPGGLINLTDSALVTGGLSGNTLRVEDIDFTPFIGVSNGTIDLTRATENVLIYDSATDPANQIATLTADGNKFTLNGSDAASLIQTINVAAGSDLTVDFTAQVTAPSGSVTVNGKTYNATTAVTLQSDGTTSTLTAGTVALANGETVNTTGGNTIAATAGDGLTVNAATDSVTVSGLNTGDTFTADGNTYTVGTKNLLHDGKLWTGDTYQDGVTLAELADDANWTNMLSATYSSVAVDGATLGDGEKAVLVDNVTDPTTTYGTLTKTDGIYLLMKDDTQDDKLAAISVQGTIIDIDVELADVPITTINADESESEFTVKPSAGVETFRVDATGNSPRIYGVDEIDLIRGKVFPQDGQIIKPADPTQPITLSYGNGTYTIGDKTITIGGLNDDETVDIEINGDGNINSVYNIPKDAYVIYDGVTYTAPFDDARLSFEEDPCYYVGYTLPEYNVQIDPDGNIKVDTGIQFGKVVQSGKTLDDDGTIQIAGDGSAVKITNESEIPLKVVDTKGDTLAENLNADDGVTFSEDGVSADDLQAVAGATVYLDDGQALTAGDETTVAAQGDATVGVGTDGESISVDGSADIDAPADTELTLGDAPYTVKGADFETSGTAQATVTSDGVKLDLGISDAITHDDMTLTGGESSTAELDGDGGVTLTSGATAANATDKPVTVDGTVQLDDKTVKATAPVEVTEKTNGLQVGDTELTVGGDSAGYQVNIDDGNISGLENIGNGATIGGLSDATIKTNEEGSITVGDKTYTTTGDSAVTYGLSEGAITSISDLDGILAGDFSDGVTVNGDPLTVDSSLKGAIAIAADEDGVSAVQTGDADTYTINGHAYETSGDALFGMSNANVTGVTTDDGTFAIGQDETDFQVNGASLTLSRNTNPVTLGISGGAISGVYGIDGTIDGLNNATVYDLTKATVNGKGFDISGTTFDAIVSDGTVSTLVGLSAPATVNTAPDVSIVTSTDGTFQVGGRGYTIDDTVDNSVTFTTDENSKLTGINNFAGSLNGAVTSLTLNGKDFGTNNGTVTVSSDGRNITAIDGLQSGDSIGGDIDSATFHMPQGNLTINGGVYTLEDDADGATASRGGKTFVGVEKDASLTVGADGSHRVNGGSGRASVGSVFTVNRDGGYMINPNYLPIIEKTPAGDIRARSDGTLALQETSGTVGAGNDTVVVRRDAEVTVDASGEPLIIATSGNVTLENYSASSASVGSFEYTNLANAIKTNAIQFGDGTMTLGDAVITFNANAGSTGSTQAQLVNAQGKEQAIGFTHTAGGTVNASGATAAQVLKGNYAEKSGDTQKSGGSNVVGGSGNDTLLVGAGDTANGGAGDDDIYITDGAFRELGALLIMSAGSDTVHNFNGGYSTASDTIRITDLNALEYETTSGLVLKSGTRQLTFDGFSTGSADLVTSSDLAQSADTATASDGSYRLKLSDGNGSYNAAIARGGRNIYVTDGDLANVFFGTNSGVNFSEYTGAVAVNLDTGTGNVGSSSAQFKGINQLTGGAGASTLTGASEVSNTLTAGTGGGQIWSNSGNDLMVGQSGKSSATTFRYLGGDGQDTIKSFDFATSADAAGDLIDITTANEVTTVSLSGGNVILYINGSETDYLTLAQGKGNDFRINNLVAQVDDRQLAFDGLANCYVANGSNATLAVDASVESAEIWLNDMGGGLHGTYYLGDITVVDGSRSAGQLILTGNALDNTILGGAGTNSIWGGYGCDNDVMIGGAGQNTFFFALVNGNDVIQGAHDGDVIDLTTVKTTDIVGTQITDSGTAIGLWDGSVLEVRSNAAVEYKTADGTYIADHASGQWVKTK